MINDEDTKLLRQPSNIEKVTLDALLYLMQNSQCPIAYETFRLQAEKKLNEYDTQGILIQEYQERYEKINKEKGKLPVITQQEIDTLLKGYDKK